MNRDYLLDELRTETSRAAPSLDRISVIYDQLQARQAVR